MAAVDDLKAARDQIASRIAELTLTYRPDYSIDGQSVSHGAELSRYQEQLERLNRLINALEPYQIISAVR